MDEQDKKQLQQILAKIKKWIQEDRPFPLQARIPIKIKHDMDEAILKLKRKTGEKIDPRDFVAIALQEKIDRIRRS